MSPVLMLGGLVALIALLIVFAMQQYRRNEPQRAATIALIPLDVLQRRARNYRIAAGIGLIGYGLLKLAVHSTRVATSGIQGFANVRGLMSSNLQGDWIVFGSTLLLSLALLLLGTLILCRSFVSQWLAAVAIAFDLMVSFMVALALYGDLRVKGGIFYLFAAVFMPSIVGTLVFMACQLHLLAAQKRRMDDVAQTS
jgi:hypothetical protein